MLPEGTAGSPLIDRRAFVRTGVLGTIAVTVLPAGVASYRTLVPHPPKLATLDLKQFAILTAICDTLLPGGETWPSASALGVPEKIDAELARWPAFERGEMKKLLAIWEHGRFGRRFTKLSSKKREKHARSWERSRLSIKRTGFLAIKALAVFFYYTQPATWSEVGYTGPWIDWTPV